MESADKNILTIGVSTRALFNLDVEHKIYETEGIERYIKYQIDHEEELLEPGVAFNLIKSLSKLNERKEMAGKNIEIIIMSRSCPEVAIRTFNSIGHYGLNISRAIFTGGNKLADFVKSNGVDLYLSSNEEDVKQVISHGIAAGLIHNNGITYEQTEKEDVRIAFDCDKVLFSSESDDIFEKEGLDEYIKNEIQKKNVPVEPGPFKNLLIKLGKLQRLFKYDNSPIQVAICTARNYPAHERVIKTFRSWGVRINQAFFLGGYDKGKALEAFNADIFFDDSEKNIIDGAKVVPACIVPQA